MWFTEFTGSQIGKVTPSGAESEVPIPTAGGRPLGMYARPGGRTMWFCEYSARKIGKFRIGH